MRWVFLYIPSARGRTHVFFIQIIGSDNPRVIIGFTRPKIGGCYGMISNTTVAPSAHICVNKSPISRNKVTSQVARVRGPQLMFNFSQNVQIICDFSTIECQKLTALLRTSVGVYLAGLPVPGPSVRQVISSSSLINSSAGPAVFRQR